MPPAELALNIDGLRATGAKAAVVSMGFGDNTRGVVAPHFSAASRIEAEGMPVLLYSLRHHDRSHDGQRFPDYMRAVAEFAELHGPVVIFVSSAASAYAAAGILEAPDYFVGGAFMGGRFNASSPLDGPGQINPEYPDIIRQVKKNWPEVGQEIGKRFLSTRTGGDTTVHEEASKLPYARNVVFTHEDLAEDANHQDGITFMLQRGLQRLVHMVADEAA